MNTKAVRKYILVGMAFLLVGALFLPGKVMAPLPLASGPLSPEQRREIQRPCIPPPRTDLRILRIFSPQGCGGRCENEDAFPIKIA
jgi:hypothetical protein